MQEGMPSGDERWNYYYQQFHQLKHFLRASCVPGTTLRARDADVPMTWHLPSKETDMQTHVQKLHLERL